MRATTLVNSCLLLQFQFTNSNDFNASLAHWATETLAGTRMKIPLLAVSSPPSMMRRKPGAGIGARAGAGFGAGLILGVEGVLQFSHALSTRQHFSKQ
jgi:hypothetical protein